MIKTIQKGTSVIEISVRLNAKVERHPGGKVLHEVKTIAKKHQFTDTQYVSTEGLEVKILAMEKAAIDFVDIMAHQETDEYKILTNLGFKKPTS